MKGWLEVGTGASFHRYSAGELEREAKLEARAAGKRLLGWGVKTLGERAPRAEAVLVVELEEPDGGRSRQTVAL